MAVTRGVSSSIGHCELSFLPRQRIDVQKAVAEHHAYRRCLAELGIRVISLPARPELPDAAFIEDTAVVVDEVAVMARMGARSRQLEVQSVARALSKYRRLETLAPPATLEGGDAMRVGRTLYVGASRRTNRDGIVKLRELLEPRGYRVKAVSVRGCLHLKTGCSYLGRKTILANRSWVDTAPMEGLNIVDVPPTEPWAANMLVIGDVVLLAGAFPRTRALLQERGFQVRTVHISELQKAEAGPSCLSLVFENRDSDKG